jgi:hypothetical protein
MQIYLIHPDIRLKISQLYPIQRTALNPQTFTPKVFSNLFFRSGFDSCVVFLLRCFEFTRVLLGDMS